MKVAVVTGSSRGIGKEIAMEFLKNGYSVVLNSRSKSPAVMSTVDHLKSVGRDVFFVDADVSKFEEAKRLICESLDYFGKVDVLVNNAGISMQKIFQDVTEPEWHGLLLTNLGSVFNCCSAVVPHMISRKRGKIINISSIWGLVGASMETHYSASKAAIIGFTKALAKELGPSNICVNCVAPGVIETQMNSSLDSNDIENLKDETPLHRLGSVQDIAKTVAFLASESADFITGQTISPNGGIVI